MADVIFVALTVAVFAVLALVVKGVERLERRERHRPGCFRPADRVPGGRSGEAGEVLETSAVSAGWLQAGLLVLALAISCRPLGDYMADLLTSPKHWRAERWLFRLMGVDADADQTWPTYVRFMLAFSAVGVVLLYAQP